MGNAYVIGHITVKDAGKWDAYRGAVPATLAPWGAELVFKMGSMCLLSMAGSWVFAPHLYGHCVTVV